MIAEAFLYVLIALLVYAFGFFSGWGAKTLDKLDSHAPARERHMIEVTSSGDSERRFIDVGGPAQAPRDVNERGWVARQVEWLRRVISGRPGTGPA